MNFTILLDVSDSRARRHSVEKEVAQDLAYVLMANQGRDHIGSFDHITPGTGSPGASDKRSICKPSPNQASQIAHRHLCTRMPCGLALT